MKIQGSLTIKKDTYLDALQNAFILGTDSVGKVIENSTALGDFLDDYYARLDGTNQSFTGNLEIEKADPTFTLKHAIDQEFWITKDDNDVTTFNQTILVGAGAGNAGDVQSTRYVQTASNLPTNGVDWSIAGWIYVTGAGTIINLGGTSSNSFRIEYVSGSTADIYVQGSATSVAQVTGGFSTNVWRSYIITYTSSTGVIRFYWNNSSVYAPTIGNFTADRALSIGARNGGSSPSGSICDEFLFYDRVLDSTDRALIYASGVPTYRPVDNAIHAWSFDQSSGSTITDYAGGGIDMTFNGTATYVTGIVPTPPTTEEMQFIKVNRSATGAVWGEVTFGEDLGYNIYEAQRHIWNIGTTEKMRMAVTTGDLLIGGTTDLAKLSVFGNASGKGIVVRNNATTPDNPFEIQNSAGTALSVFNSSAHLGVGTSTPARNVHIADTATPYLRLDRPFWNGVGSGAGILEFAQHNASSINTPTAQIAAAMANGTNGSESTLIDFQTKISGTMASRVRVSEIGSLLIGTTIPAHSSLLDVSSGALTVVLGADSNLRTRTNSTNKISRVGGYHYTNTEEPVGMILHSSSNTASAIFFGGGTSTFNAATEINFYTAANTTTVTGTNRLQINSAGNIITQSDNQSLIFGAGQDASMYYDGTNFIINPKLVGSGVLSILGDLSILDEDIILGTTTGSKIGTDPAQKIGLWNTTPIVQPTTSITESTFTENLGGTFVNDDSTFDGYTIGQVVKALRSLGALA